MLLLARTKMTRTFRFYMQPLMTHVEVILALLTGSTHHLQVINCKVSRILCLFPREVFIITVIGTMNIFGNSIFEQVFEEILHSRTLHFFLVETVLAKGNLPRMLSN